MIKISIWKRPDGKICWSRRLDIMILVGEKNTPKIIEVEEDILHSAESPLDIGSELGGFLNSLYLSY